VGGAVEERDRERGMLQPHDTYCRRPTHGRSALNWPPSVTASCPPSACRPDPAP
jgi:hypothetical protein